MCIRDRGGISGSLTGVFGGGILLFNGLLLLPAGKRIAGKLGIFLQRFLVQNIYIVFAYPMTGKLFNEWKNWEDKNTKFINITLATPIEICIGKRGERS